ncbi:MAG: carbohydrate ABC transporter permease [Alphaproteobacteria bacterium]|nr:carbohydrate ABC transporter permease [Alphaproteobacteria bacterium]
MMLRQHVARFWVHAVLIIAAAFIMVPFLWITSSAFKTQIAILTGQFLFEPTLDNVREVILSSTSDYITAYRNSFVVATISTLLVLVIATLAAYAMDRLQTPRWIVHSLLGWAALFHMIPPVTMVGAWFQMYRETGLDNTFTGLVLAHVTLNLPIALWLMANFIRDVPLELEEAARIDGCSTPRLIWRIIVPLVRPGLAATGILVFIFSWNEFVVALSLTARDTQTVPVAISKYSQEFEIKHAEMAAAAFLSILPAFVLLLIGQRHIVKGITTGAVK